MDGIVERKFGENIILEIHDLSDELKRYIKETLIEICHGEYALISGFQDHTFKCTIDELVNHRIHNSSNKQIGIVGELLINVMVRNFTSMKIISPFFNLEERNVKKGFDIIAVEDDYLWLIESKAGEPRSSETPTKKMCERLKAANNDLNSRLNQNNSQLWLNAINSIRSAMDDTSEKKTIMNILNANHELNSSNNKNVVLGGTIFFSLDSGIEQQKIDNLYHELIYQNIFQRVRIIAIHKQTYQAVIDYLYTLSKES